MSPGYYKYHKLRPVFRKYNFTRRRTILILLLTNNNFVILIFILPQSFLYKFARIANKNFFFKKAAKRILRVRVKGRPLL